MITFVAKCHGKPGSGDVLNLLHQMAPVVKAQEPGCHLYQASRSTEDPEIFLLYEQYADEDALIAHRETTHFKEIIEANKLSQLEERQREIYLLVVA